MSNKFKKYCNIINTNALTDFDQIYLYRIFIQTYLTNFIILFYNILITIIELYVIKLVLFSFLKIKS